MPKKKFIAFLSAIALVVVVGSAAEVYALELGTNITIYDKVVSGSSPGWWNKGNSPGEDQEVEPNCVRDQIWDLEGFFLQGSKLSMVGGFNFKNGVPGYTYKSGHIFIDVNGNAQYGPVASGSGSGNSIVNNTFGYDYALVMNFASNTYDVVKLNNNATTKTVTYQQNDHTNPWAYNAGGTTLLTNFLFSDYQAGLTDTQIGNGLTGGLHYLVTVDLGFLPGNERNIISHFTMECGNDNLMGQGSIPFGGPPPAPIPGSVWLLGTGFLGLALLGLRRKPAPIKIK